MKFLPLVLALATIAPAHAIAHDRCGFTLASLTCDGPSRWGPRHDAAEARYAITTEEGDVTLVLDQDVVAIQLSDRAFHKIDRRLRAKRQDSEDDHVLGRVIKSVVLNSVREVLDRSLECPRRHIASASYEGGRLVLVTHDGDELFENLEVNDREVMEGFSEADARRFVREFRRATTSANRGR